MCGKEWKILRHYQDRLKDGTWSVYHYERFDDRDIMNDTWYPNWRNTGRYLVEIMRPNVKNSGDATVHIETDKKCANLISAHMKSGKYTTYSELVTYLIAVMKRCGEYRYERGIHYGKITEELYNKEVAR